MKAVLIVSAVGFGTAIVVLVAFSLSSIPGVCLGFALGTVLNELRPGCRTAMHLLAGVLPKVKQ